jgi:hypothetical protein
VRLVKGIPVFFYDFDGNVLVLLNAYHDAASSFTLHNHSRNYSFSRLLTISSSDRVSLLTDEVNTTVSRGVGSEHLS